MLQLHGKIVDKNVFFVKSSYQRDTPPFPLNRLLDLKWKQKYIQLEANLGRWTWIYPSMKERVKMKWLLYIKYDWLKTLSTSPCQNTVLMMQIHQWGWNHLSQKIKIKCIVCSINYIFVVLCSSSHPCRINNLSPVRCFKSTNWYSSKCKHQPNTQYMSCK
jgi:hypothetical protein